MSNLHEVKPAVKTITLSDGVEREVRFTLNAMAELEDRYGSVQAAFDAMEQNSVKAIRFVLWAGLVDASPDLTEKQVGSLIDLGNLKTFVESITGALTANLPADDAEAQLPNG